MDLWPQSEPVLTEQTAVAQGVGGAYGASWERSTSWGVRNATGWEEDRSPWPQVLSFSHSPWPLHPKKKFLSSGDNLLSSHPLKLWLQMAWLGRATHRGHVGPQIKKPSSRSDSCQLQTSQHFSCFSFFIFKWQDGLKGKVAGHTRRD